MLVGVYLRVQYTARYRTRGRGTVEQQTAANGSKKCEVTAIRILSLKETL